MTASHGYRVSGGSRVVAAGLGVALLAMVGLGLSVSRLLGGEASRSHPAYPLQTSYGRVDQSTPRP